MQADDPLAARGDGVPLGVGEGGRPRGQKRVLVDLGVFCIVARIGQFTGILRPGGDHAGMGLEISPAKEEGLKRRTVGEEATFPSRICRTELPPRLSATWTGPQKPACRCRRRGPQVHLHKQNTREHSRAPVVGGVSSRGARNSAIGESTCFGGSAMIGVTATCAPSTPIWMMQMAESPRRRLTSAHRPRASARRSRRAACGASASSWGR
mmetsp:Transcript_28468/g.90715  ORF Transcript_28468/g.90715 Transcript_28468/m.90715 type:complete len:210 (+) Transcript_28468:368-997(+)